LNVSPNEVISGEKSIVLIRKEGNEIDGYKQINIAKVEKIGDFELRLPLHFDNGIKIRI
jgi:hypothetical protein